MFDSLTTRTPNGLTNAAPWQTMAAAGIPDPSWAHVYHNDFDTFAAGDWTITKVGTGTTALTPLDGGALRLTTTAGIADAVYLQTVSPGFLLRGAGDTFFKANAILSDVVNSVAYFGLLATTTTPGAPADGIYIRKTSGAATFFLDIIEASVVTSFAFPASAVPVNAVAFEVGFHSDGLGNVEAFFNPTTGATVPRNASTNAGGSVVKATGQVITVDLTSPIFGFANTTASAKTMDVDYITAVRER